MEIFRIVEGQWSESAFDGEGARLYGGRWNHEGVAMIYTASSRSLAILEQLVHLEDANILHSQYVIFKVIVDDRFIMNLGDALPIDWQKDPAPHSTKTLGDDWIKQQASVVLGVPSSLVAEENNYLINPSHSDFNKLIINNAVPLTFDQRLILK